MRNESIIPDCFLDFYKNTFLKLLRELLRTSEAEIVVVLSSEAVTRTATVSKALREATTKIKLYYVQKLYIAHNTAGKPLQLPPWDFSSQCAWSTFRIPVLQAKKLSDKNCNFF